ncbi:MAG: ATPase, T2SS/T4P/T4SS family [Erysipelotrichaceae bacterium]
MFDFGILQKYVNDDLITDIDSNSITVYVTHQFKGTYLAEKLSEGYLKDLINKLCNADEINASFNYEQPILDGVIDGLRIHAEHDSFISSGDTLAIRKNPLKLVITENNIKDTKYCTFGAFELLKVLAKANVSVMFGGEVGTGKTQLMKTFLSLTDESSNIVFISDIDEMRMTQLYPERNYRQCIINPIIDYTKATKSILRDNPVYVCFQEVRDNAVDDLFLALSSSARVCGTVHLKSALIMPQRLMQLSNNKNDKHLLSTIHDYIQVCVVPYKTFKKGRMIRYIGEIAMFWNDENGVPRKKLVYEQRNNHIKTWELPDYFKEFFKKEKIEIDWSEKIEKI